MRSWQSRLNSRLNHISQKLSDNAIANAGDLTDLIRIHSNYTKQMDIESRTVTDIDVVNIMFPAVRDIPMWRFANSGYPRPAEISTEVLDLLECYAPVASKVDQDDLLLKYIENPAGEEPWILILQVKDILGTFGSRTLIWQKLNVTFYDEALPQELLDYCADMAERRGILNW